MKSDGFHVKSTWNLVVVMKSARHCLPTAPYGVEESLELTDFKVFMHEICKISCENSPDFIEKQENKLFGSYQVLTKDQTTNKKQTKCTKVGTAFSSVSRPIFYFFVSGTGTRNKGNAWIADQYEGSAILMNYSVICDRK